MNSEEFIQFFGLRKPRSTRKPVKDNETKYTFDEYRFNNGFLKIFNQKLSYNLLERYFKAHDITELYFIFENKLIKNNLYSNYYTSLRDYEDISKNYFKFRK